jgi:hypothetical protein
LDSTECLIVTETNKKGKTPGWSFFAALPGVLPETLILVANQARQDPADETDEQGTEKGPPETIHLEASNQSRHHPKKEGVDHQEEEPQSENCKGESKQDKDGSDNGVDDPQENRRTQGGPDCFHPH